MTFGRKIKPMTSTGTVRTMGGPNSQSHLFKEDFIFSPEEKKGSNFLVIQFQFNEHANRSIF